MQSASGGTSVKEGGQGAIEEFLDNPYLNVAIIIIEGLSC